MAERSLSDRVKILEKQMESLQSLPGKVDVLDARVDSLAGEFLHFRIEIGAEISTTREELLERMGGLHEVAMTRTMHLEDRMEALHETAMTRMDTLHATAMNHAEKLHGIALTRMDALHEAAITRMEALHEAAMTRIGVLHEDLVSRMAAIGELFQNGKTNARRHRRKR